MRRTKHVIAVVVVATALCADRSVAATSARPAPKVQPRSLASRITSGLKRTVAPASPVLSVRSSERAQSFPLRIREESSGVRAELSPFQFRLPPPAR